MIIGSAGDHPLLDFDFFSAATYSTHSAESNDTLYEVVAINFFKKSTSVIVVTSYEDKLAFMVLNETKPVSCRDFKLE